MTHLQITVDKLYHSVDEREHPRRITKISRQTTTGGFTYKLIHWEATRNEQGISTVKIFTDWLNGKYTDGLRRPKKKL